MTFETFFDTVGMKRQKMKKGIDYIGVGVGAVIFNQNGGIFLAKRGKEARNERSRWEFPGGGVEFGETLENAIVREVKEEYDFQIEVLLDVVNHIIPDEDRQEPGDCQSRDSAESRPSEE